MTKACQCVSVRRGGGRSTDDLAMGVGQFEFLVEESTLAYRERMLLTYLRREYTHYVASRVLIPLITQQCPVSLRALDWAVVNWAKQNRVVCRSTRPGERTNVHQSYRASLSYWKRKLFDPFRRRAKIKIVVDGCEFDTTLGQANWALWCYRSGTLSYVISNIEEIEVHMNQTFQEQKRARVNHSTDNGPKHVRRELTNTPTATCVVYPTPVRVVFT